MQPNAIAFTVFNQGNETVRRDLGTWLQNDAAGVRNAIQHGVELAFHIEINAGAARARVHACHRTHAAADAAVFFAGKMPMRDIGPSTIGISMSSARW